MATLAHSHGSANSFCYFSSWKSTHHGESRARFLSSQEFLKPSHTPHGKILHKIFCFFPRLSPSHTEGWKVLLLIQQTHEQLGGISWARFLHAILAASFSPLNALTPIWQKCPSKKTTQSVPNNPWCSSFLFHWGIHSLRTWQGCGKEHGMGELSSLWAGIMAYCMHQRRGFSEGACSILPGYEGLACCEKQPKISRIFVLVLVQILFFFFFSSFLFSNLLGINLLLLVFFFPPLCELLPFSSCLTEQCSMSQCWQAKYWVVKCYFLKQHERAHQQKMVQDYRHWKKHHVHLMLAVHIMCLHLGV